MEPAMNARPSDHALKALSDGLEGKPPEAVLDYALTHYFPKIVLACSFGAEDVTLVDMMLRINSKASLFYLDTDFLFPETYALRDTMIATYHLPEEQIIQVKAGLTPEEQATLHGEALWLRNPDRCCTLRKVEPLKRILQNYSAWITGIRRDQSPTRAQTSLIEWDESFHLVKVNPLACWSWEQVWTYIRHHHVPYNVLHDQQYPSIGCTHCTSPILPGEDPRSGRWKHFGKTECGLHR